MFPITFDIRCEDPKNGVIIAGYTVEGTLAFELENRRGASRVSLQIKSNFSMLVLQFKYSLLIIYVRAERTKILWRLRAEADASFRFDAQSTQSHFLPTWTILRICALCRALRRSTSCLYMGESKISRK